MHHRFFPKVHAFQYGMALWYLDLDELDRMNSFMFGVENFRPYAFWRKDYHRPQDGDLKCTVLETVLEHDKPSSCSVFTGREKVFILTQPRVFGFCFNPVSFYFIFDETQTQWLAVLAEINNTPWDERHSYVLWNHDDSDQISSSFKKNFHVSPFMNMDQQYEWAFSKPTESFSVHMENFEQEKLMFKAHLDLAQRSLSSMEMVKITFQFPLCTIKTMVAIYWNALVLKIKGVPYVEHSKPEPKEKRYAS